MYFYFILNTVPRASEGSLNKKIKRYFILHGNYKGLPLGEPHAGSAPARDVPAQN